MFENLDTGLFSIQNRDFFGKEPVVPINWSRDLEQIYLELLIEKNPENRCLGGSKTIQEAISKYDNMPLSSETECDLEVD